MLRYVKLFINFLIINRKYLIHLPRSLYFNLKYFDLRSALRLPIFISNKTRFINLNGTIEVQAKLSSGMIKIGFPTAEVFFDERHYRGAIDNHGKIIFFGKAVLGQGTRIFVKSSGELIFGENFWGTAENNISCHKKIQFGKSVLLSFRILLMDTDTHHILSAQNRIILNPNKSIVIGDNVWIGCNSIILKGTEISNNSIVGAGTVVAKQFDKSHLIIAGNPARIIKEEVVWEG